ncbi:MAG: hypothetical protein FJ279_22380 [Planctomycetes bacterium]|nr:hypothetical protein [Planctomycetota bacterium]MBM4081675.1 hypothetical protein [Planctomycetota bacterium]
MRKSRFDKAFVDFVQRGEERVTPKTFSQVLAEIEAERAKKTIELRAKIVEGKLRFQPSHEIPVHDNEIVWGNQRIVVKVS